MVKNLLRVLCLLLLGLWLGAAIFFSAAVAPSVFAVLRDAGLANSSSLAGSIVSRLLGTLNRAGFEIAVFVLVINFFLSRRQKLARRVVGMISLAIMAIMTGLGHWVIAARMATLRAAMQLPIDQIALTDARRIEFDNLHRYSVTVMAIAIVATLVAFIMLARESPPPITRG